MQKQLTAIIEREDNGYVQGSALTSLYDLLQGKLGFGIVEPESRLL
ncbi:MAG: hypothetical protein SVY53_00740 [Chloroflexota bacterium]|nr:hypothetical protein [Chloroflexota bacterium]